MMRESDSGGDAGCETSLGIHFRGIPLLLLAILLPYSQIPPRPEQRLRPVQMRSPPRRSRMKGAFLLLCPIFISIL